MIISFRLKQEQERRLKQAARRAKRSRSEFVREAIARYADQCLETSKETAAERLAPWIGKYDSGGMNLSENTSQKFLKILQQKQRARRRPS